MNKIPTVKITHPIAGDNLSEVVRIYGRASDVDGIIQYVQVKIDAGEWVNVPGTILWNYTWDTTKLDDGEYIIYARSFDGIDYSNVSFITINIKNSATPGFEILFFIIGFILFFMIYKRYK